MLSDRDYMSGQRRTGWAFGPHQSVIKPLIIANVIVFMLTGFGDDRSTIKELLSLHPIYIHQFQIWRLGTYMFVHGGFLHILMNMWGLYIFGTPVERRIGSHRFLNLYMVSGIAGGLCWLLANWWGDSGVLVPVPLSSEQVLVPVPLSSEQVLALKQQGLQVGRMDSWTFVRGSASVILRNAVPFTRTEMGVVGASGAVFGVMMAAAMACPDLRLMLIFPPIPVTIRGLVLFYGISEVLWAWQNAMGAQSRIAHIAHLGGLVGAFLFMNRLSGRSVHSQLTYWRRELSHWWAKVMAKLRQRRFRKTGPPGTDRATYNRNMAAEADRILDKMAAEGEASLTADEKRILKETSEALKRRSKKW